MLDFKAAVFDLDGTLLDSMWFWGDIDRVYLARHGITVPDDYMLAIAHLGSYQTAVYTKERFGLSETPEQMINDWTKLAAEFYAERVKLKDGAFEYLSELKRLGVKLAVATANDETLYVPALRLNGIDSLFDAKVNVNEVERKKGFPDIYMLACEKMGVNIADAVVFEDILIGINGAADGGFRTVGVFDETSSRDTDKIKAAADRFIYSFRELLPINV